VQEGVRTPPAPAPAYTPPNWEASRPSGGVVKLDNLSKKLASIDVRRPVRSLSRTQPFLMPKT
jgi:hypothetical protein